MLRSRGRSTRAGLAALVEQAVPRIEAAIRDAMSSSRSEDHPVLITEAALLARYRHMAMLSRLADITTSREQAVWLVVPEEGGGGPLLDRVPVPLTYASQFVHIDSSFAMAEGDAR